MSRAGELSLGNSHPTYEELKLKYIHLAEIRYHNSHPTYEELKQGFQTGFSFQNFIHILPMRNWNSCHGVSWCECSFNSHPTYEELKRTFQEGGVVEKPNSHPTYEELKLGTIIDMRPAFSNSHPTYEELKHQYSESMQEKVVNSHPTYEELKPGSVWSMWAGEGYSHPTYEELKLICKLRALSSPFEFTSYLWGIETY